MTEWWRGGVIYQIYPRSFMDSNGDGVGDLPGIFQKLDHVASLGGIDAIWISPFFKSPMKDFGYDVSSYRDVDPVFGTLDDFHRVLGRAHELGLKVIIDQVWSHTSDEHLWFKESRQNRTNEKHDWYVWVDPRPDGTAPNNWLSYFGGPAWTWDSRREQYYLHHFLKEQPALNLWNPAVRAAIKDVAAYWLDMGVDGFRLDAMHTWLHDRKYADNPARAKGSAWPTDVAKSNPMAYQLRVKSSSVPENLDLIEEFRAFVDQWPNRCLLGEAGGEDSEKEAAVYTQTGKRLQQAYSFGLVGSGMTRDEITYVLNKIDEILGDGWICWAINNHDVKRVASRIAGEAPLADKAIFATALGLMLRGSYCMYQGEELGLPQSELAYEDLVDPYDRMLYPEHMGRDGGRTPMPWIQAAPNAGFSSARKTWLPLNPSHLPLTVDMQEQDPHSALNETRRLLSWRKSQPAIQLGTFRLLDTPGPVLGFTRSLRKESFTAFFNCGDTPAEVATSADFGTLDPISRHAQPGSGKTVLGPFGYAVFRHE